MVPLPGENSSNVNTVDPCAGEATSRSITHTRKNVLVSFLEMAVCMTHLADAVSTLSIARFPAIVNLETTNPRTPNEPNEPKTNAFPDDVRVIFAQP